MYRTIQTSLGFPPTIHVHGTRAEAQAFVIDGLTQVGNWPFTEASETVDAGGYGPFRARNDDDEVTFWIADPADDDLVGEEEDEDLPEVILSDDDLAWIDKHDR